MDSEKKGRIAKTVRWVNLSLFVALVLFFLCPRIYGYFVSQSKVKSKRDASRVIDLQILQGMIDAYFVEFGYYPASVTNQPFIDSSSEIKETGIWIQSLGGKKKIMQPIDPINSSQFVYRYKSSKPPATAYELDCQFERGSSLIESDNGNSAKRYEIGTDLTLMGDY
jgi:hypothetical protein